MNPFNFYKYLPGVFRKKLKGKYIVIESDDWGMEAANPPSLEWMKRKFGENRFTRWSLDHLETSADLEKLFSLFSEYKHKFSHPPVITANFVTHNVDYTSEQELRFIPISKGFNSFSENVTPLYLKGLKEGIFFPQLHGYCHHNHSVLREFFKTEAGKESFQYGFLTAILTIKNEQRFGLRGELCRNNTLYSSGIVSATEVFKETFGFRSNSIIPPNFMLDREVIPELKKAGINTLQAGSKMVNCSGKRYFVPYYRKFKGMIWGARTARLDPHPDYNHYSDSCLRFVEDAFKKELPAVIDCHRVNFAGTFTPDYRDRTLSELKIVFDTILKRWPDAKFVNTQQLSEIYGTFSSD